MYITLSEYAQRHGKEPSSARHLIARGSLKSAEKRGRDWFVDENEPWPDRRLKAKDLFDKSAYTELTDKHRQKRLKYERAAEYSGWKSHVTTCSQIFKNIPDDWFDRYTAKQLGEIAALIKKVYDKGVYYGRNHPEE